MKPSLIPSALFGLLLSAVALPALADIDSALNAYGEQKYDAAFREFSQLSAAGDNRAKSFLALMTLRGQGTVRDVKQGAKLARECAEGGEPTCAAIYGELNLPGKGLPVDFAEARTWTRKAIAAGDQRAGYVLWQAYSLDPANQYIVNGKPDQNKYNAIARRDIAERGNQIEAIDALAGAAAAGYVPARLMLATLLLEQSGAGTTRQIRSLLNGIPDLPPNYQKYLALAQQVDTLGPSRAAPKVIADAIPVVMTGAALAAERSGTPNATQCKDFRLMSIRDVSRIGDAVWLPLKHPLVADTYPLKGSWTEDWHVFFCGAERTLRMQFDVDGMGGAYYKVKS
ncbi:tetratricopeptide repeat protein [Herbaspirillum sp. RV1423]|uniref:tetratricopeptide repeat protein n=1 Tax=Herbaspirillum sp. RV1423 TaxID=1443993 RepID=UPI0004B6EA84|nr:sel1 repeat family protein [Herbaspirillum sp. RV1423]